MHVRRYLTPVALGLVAPALTLAPVHAAGAQQPASGGAAQPATPVGRGRVTGTVTDEETKRPIPGVTVRLVGTASAALTDSAGRYAIANVAPGVFNVEARRIGYGLGRHDNLRVERDGTLRVDFALRDNPLRLQDVVVSATVDPISGVKTPFSVAKLSAEDMPVPPNMSAAGVIQGKVASAKIIRAGGPGAGVNIQLRTPTSQFNSNSPIFVVDGVILNTQATRTTGDIESIDIASVEVINGASAATLYGSLGANGVISIRTNRGQGLALGATQFALRSEGGFNQFTRAPQKARFHQYRVNAAGQYVNAAGTVVSRAQRTLDPDGFKDNPYADPLYDAADIFEAGQFNTVNLSLAQNTAGTNFAVIYNRYREQGVVEGAQGYTRQNLRVNVDHRRGDNFELGVSAYHQRSMEDPTVLSFSDFFNFDPDVDLRARAADGNYHVRPDSTSTLTNPFYRQQVYRDDLTRRGRTLLNTTLKYRPLSWLTLDASMGYDRSDRQYESFIPRGILETNGQALTLGSFQRDVDNVEGTSFNFGATYLDKFGDLTTRFGLSALIQREVNPFTRATATDFSVTGVRDLDVGLTRSVSSSLTDRRMNSGLASLGLDYADKLIGDFAIRREGNSLYGPDSRWNNFYRASAAYRLSQESWWGVPGFTDFKLRYSYGTAGNRPGFYDQYEALSLAAGGLPTRQSLGNRALKPEIASEHEFGIDAILRDRVSVTLAYARQKSTNNIVTIPLPALTGFNTQNQNVGDIRGNSLEATIQAQLVRRRNVSWDMNLVADRQRSEIGTFGRSCYTDGILYRCAGANLGEMWGNRFVGSLDDLPAVHARSRDRFQVNDEGYVVAVGAGNGWRDGIAKGLWGTTVNVDGVNYAWGRPILRRDSVGNTVYEKIGSSFSDVNLGLGNTVKWRGVTLYGLVTGQVGGNIYNNIRQGLYSSGDHPDVVQAGKPDELKKPLLYYTAVDGVSSGNGNYNSAFVEDGSFLKLSEASVRFSLPARFLSRLGRLGADRAAIELIGRNLFILTDYRGIDPEAGTPLQRVENTGYPLYRTITAAVNLAF